MAYMDRQLKAAISHPEIFKRGQASHVCVQHDDFCPIVREGLEPCICKPDILVLLLPDGDRYEIDEAGELRTPRPGIACGHGLEKLGS